jgi:uncharacterized RDD family membrane protein YckC
MPVPAYGSALPPAYLATKRPATTPDGVPLAGWWWRVLAYVLDAILVGIVVALVAAPWISDAYQIYRDWFDDLVRTFDAGDSSTVDTEQLQRDLARPIAFIVGIQLVVGFCYHVGFLMWKQATPGKLMVGLRVRLRERPGPMPLGTVMVRWASQFGVAILNLVPVVGALIGIYTLLDVLWPIWDDKKQALHDKIARTNVVRVP